MIATDTQVERYGADVPLTDLQRCFNGATHAVTTGDYTAPLLGTCSADAVPHGRERQGVPAPTPTTV